MRYITKYYEIGVIMFKEIYKHLKLKGFNVYSIGQHEGICNEPYLVIKENGESEIAGTNLSNDIVEILIYYPKGSYSTLEDYRTKVKDIMKDLSKLRRVVNPSPTIIDDDKKAYMTSFYYRKIKQLRK